MSDQPFEPNENPFRKHKGIVFVVVTLGILIVLGFAGLVYGIALKASKSTEDAPPAVSTSQPLPPVPMISGGSSALGMAAGDGNVYLTLRLDDGTTVLRAYDEQGALLFETPVSTQ